MVKKEIDFDDDEYTEADDNAWNSSMARLIQDRSW